MMMRFGVVLGLFLLVALPEGVAQPAKEKGKAGARDQVVSPEVREDRRVTFRLHAPKASEVSLRGDWMDSREPVMLEKGKDGVWATTVGPLVPDFYSYAFNVDGVKTIDP